VCIIDRSRGEPARRCVYSQSSVGTGRQLYLQSRLRRLTVHPILCSVADLGTEK